VTPPGVNPEHQRVRSVSIVLPKDANFVDTCRDALAVQPGTRHASV
jgi:phthalate 4,5-dioxygenase